MLRSASSPPGPRSKIPKNCQIAADDVVGRWQHEGTSPEEGASGRRAGVEGAAMAVRGSSTRGQAAAGQGRRRSRTSVWLTEREWAAVCAAAAVAGRKPGAWISATAVQAASRRNAGRDRTERAVVERLIEQLWQQRRGAGQHRRQPQRRRQSGELDRPAQAMSIIAFQMAAMYLGSAVGAALGARCSPPESGRPTSPHGRWPPPCSRRRSPGGSRRGLRRTRHLTPHSWRHARASHDRLSDGATTVDTRTRGREGRGFSMVQNLAITSADTLLVHGAAGNVGSATVRIALDRGPRVIGTASAHNHSYLRSHRGRSPSPMGTDSSPRPGPCSLRVAVR